MLNGKAFFWLIVLGVGVAGCDTPSPGTGGGTGGETGEPPADDDNDVPPQPSTTGGTSSGGETGEPVGFCGDGVVGGNEDCDGLDRGGLTCLDFGAMGTLGCNDDCTFDECTCVWEDGGGCEEPGPAVCGNGDAEAGEECDGSDIPGWEFGPTCADVLGYEYHGEVGCSGDCTIDTSACGMCGDGIVQDDYEACDGSPAVDDKGEPLQCSNELGPDYAGTVGCSDECFLDTDSCELLCGNGVLDAGEECDGEPLEPVLCSEEIGPDYEGTVGCSSACLFDLGPCMPLCGNGEIDPGEECDGASLDGASCGGFGFLGGNLACSSACTYDISTCDNCGDGIIDEGEDCDGAALGGITCNDFLPNTFGPIGCTLGCTADVTACEPGDGSVVISEIMIVSFADPLQNEGEWIELHNPGASDGFELLGCSVEGVAPFETFVVEESLVIPPGGFVTMGKGTLEELGFTPDYELPVQTTFLNSGDTITFDCPAASDSVDYSLGSFPDLEAGIAIAVETPNLTAAGNDDGAAWCSAPTSYGENLYGTPGASNDCP